MHNFARAYPAVSPCGVPLGAASGRHAGHTFGSSEDVIPGRTEPGSTLIPTLPPGYDSFRACKNQNKLPNLETVCSGCQGISGSVTQTPSRSELLTNAARALVSPVPKFCRSRKIFTSYHSSFLIRPSPHTNAILRNGGGPDFCLPPSTLPC